jgi:uncharacterized protein (TIGR02217 family)
MAVWPESNPYPQYPLEITPVWQTQVVNLGGGGEQRRAAWLYPKFDVVVYYDALTYADAQTLWQFYMARRGAYEAFHIYDLSLLNSITFTQATALYCGTGDGSTTTFDLPGRSTSSQTIYLNGQEQSSGYTMLVGGGDSSADRVQFTTAPAAGDIVTAAFAGYLRMRVRFADDRLGREQFTADLFRYSSIALKGLKPL